MSRGAGDRERFRSAALPLIATAAMLGVAASPGPDARPQARRHVVEIRGFAYLPAQVSAAVGDTIVWINRDVVPHTATAVGGDWDSRAIPSGGSWRRVVAAGDTAGYTCTYHPSMSGGLVIR